MPDNDDGLDLDALVDALNQALDGLLTARILVGDFPVPMPEAVLEAALGAHPMVAEARKQVSDRLHGLLEAVGPEGRDAILEMEELTWALVGKACEASWAAALLWSTANKSSNKE